jgi:23S rRNA (pseudouridine1915-N3)-methyltransferase
VRLTVRLRILAVGRDRSGLYAPAIEEYAGRLKRYARFELVEVPEARTLAGTPRAREEEGEALLAKISPREQVVALDERGDELTSAGLAEHVRRWQARGQDVTLVIGGADGLAPGVLARAGEKLALSRFTLAHRLARLVLVEQLYRAFTILRGEPYHK